MSIFLIAALVFALEGPTEALVVHEVDDFTDEPRVSLIFKSEDTTALGKAGLFFQCRGVSVVAHLLLPGARRGDGFPKVKWRVDKGEVAIDYWDFPAGANGAYLRYVNTADYLSGDMLVLEMDGYIGRFQVGDHKAKIEEWFEGCAALISD